MIARHELTLSAYGRVFFCLLPTKLACDLLGRKGSNVESALDIGSKEHTTHFVSNDTHIEAQIDLDAGMQLELTMNNGQWTILTVWRALTIGS